MPSTSETSVHQLSATQVRAEIEDLQTAHGFRRPTRSTIDPERPWKDGVPNYDVADLLFFRGKTQNHAEGSLEEIVENAVKIWEMEATHLEFADWSIVEHSQYKVQANGGKVFKGVEGARAGNYNWLMENTDKSLYDASAETFESSHRMFRDAFLGGFPWEVLRVFSGPPRIAFSWRHWAKFEGVYKGRVGDGKCYEMYGWGILDVNEELKVKSIEIFYRPDEFLRAMESGETEGLGRGEGLVGAGCPFLQSNSK